MYVLVLRKFSMQRPANSSGFFRCLLDCSFVLTVVLAASLAVQSTCNNQSVDHVRNHAAYEISSAAVDAYLYSSPLRHTLSSELHLVAN